jgi:outer membrane murein-binding lipoprotein Lpp
MHRSGSRLSGAAALTVALCVGILAGCASNEPTRPEQSSAQLLAAREAADARNAQELNAMTGQLLERVKREYDEYAAGHTQMPPMLDVLVISGGGD